MIELTVKTFLEDLLNVPVLFEKPTDSEIEEFVLIEKTGSSRENFINSATIAIQSFSNSLYTAASLNEEVKKALLGNGVSNYGIIENSNISKCELNSDYNYTDASVKQYKYQAVFDLVY